MKKITKITKRDKKYPVYDIQVEDAEHYILENGVVTHNSGLKYSAQTMWIISKSQEKEGTELKGFTFNINIEKSRFIEEKSKIPLTVRFDGGIDYYSGLFEIALELKFIEISKQGWYCMKGSDKNFRKADANPYIDSLMKSDEFRKAVEYKYKLLKTGIISTEVNSDEFEDLEVLHD